MLDTLLATPRIRLAELPIPVQYCPRLTDYLEGPRIYVKRDDLTGLGLGGNKVRKLEFVLAEALSQGADTVVSAGVVQSNSVRQGRFSKEDSILFLHTGGTPALYAYRSAFARQLATLSSALSSSPHDI